MFSTLSVKHAEVENAVILTAEFTLTGKLNAPLYQDFPLYMDLLICERLKWYFKLSLLQIQSNLS